MGNDNFTASPSGAFRTGEGLLNIAANKQEQFEALCRCSGRPELVADPRFAEREARKQHRAALTAELEKALAVNGAAYWERELNAAGVPAGQVLTVAEALGQEQVLHRQLLMPLPFPDPERPEITVTRSGFTVDGKATGVDRPPPQLGEHADDILRELGYDDVQIAQLRETGAL